MFSISYISINIVPKFTIHSSAIMLSPDLNRHNQEGLIKVLNTNYSKYLVVEDVSKLPLDELILEENKIYQVNSRIDYMRRNDQNQDIFVSDNNMNILILLFVLLILPILMIFYNIFRTVNTSVVLQI